MNLTKIIDFLVQCLGNERGEISLSGGADGGAAGDPGAGDPGVSGEGATGDPGAGVPLEFEGVEFPADLEDGIRYDPSMKPFIGEDKKINYGNILKSYVHAQRKMGEKGITVPDKNAGEEDWTNFFNNIRPSDLSKYEIKPQLAEGQETPTEMLNAFKEMAHKQGLMPKQAEEMFNWYNNKEQTLKTDLTKQQETVYNKDVEQLKADWGEDFDGQFNVAKRAFAEFADEATTEYLVKTGLDKNPQLIRLFNKVGKGLLTEDTFKQESRGKFAYTKEDADKKVKDIMSDMTGPYYNKDHMKHNDVVEEVNKLMQITVGG